MSTHYDEKGKFFTDVISKKRIPVIIQTSDQRIEGVVHARRGERLKDELNRNEQFLAVTEALIYEGQQETLFNSDFLAINKDAIVWIFPSEGEDNEVVETE